MNFSKIWEFVSGARLVFIVIFGVHSSLIKFLYAVRKTKMQFNIQTNVKFPSCVMHGR
jgi:hypothetical protein